jgi:AP-1 complex subunit beta-1
MENLLDIDFDGAAPASTQGQAGLEGLAGTPQRVASPATTAQPQSNMDDLLGLFGDGGGSGGAGASGAPTNNDDIMNGFAGMSIQNNQPAPAAEQLGGEGSKKSNQDLLDLF